jgi:Zn-dependent membrane protease YugP
MFLWNTTYMMYMIPAFLLMMLAQMWVNSQYRKWSQVRNSNNITGADAARRLLNYGGLGSVSLEGTQGRLSDHYDPRKRILRLSPGVAQGQTVASLAITAHEIGHAMQDKEDYFPLRFRAALVPAANIGSRFGFLLIFIGLILGGVLGTQLAWIGVAAFALGAVFAFATLPVELNASARARALLTQSGLIQTRDEKQGVNAVLNAAALTYIASLAAAVLQLLYWVSLVGGMGSRRRR